MYLNVNTNGASAFVVTPGSLNFTFPPGSTVPQNQQVTLATSGRTHHQHRQHFHQQWRDVADGHSEHRSCARQHRGQRESDRLVGRLYFGAVALNPPGTNGFLIPVQVNVTAPSNPNVGPQQLSFAYQTGTTAPQPQNLTLSSAGGGVISFTASASTTSCGRSWLIVSPQSSATPASLKASRSIPLDYYPATARAPSTSPHRAPRIRHSRFRSACL